MALLISRPIFAIIAALSLCLSIKAADDEKHYYIPGSYEIARRAKPFIDADKERVDAALVVIIDIINLENRGQESIIDAALLLNALVKINKKHALGTKQRNNKLNGLIKAAKTISDLHSKKPQRKPDYNWENVLDTIDADPVAKNFLLDYRDGVYKYQQVELKFSAAIGLGLSAGGGFALHNYLSGDLFIAPCATVGTTCLFGADSSLEYTKGTTKSYVNHSWRRHRAHFFGVVHNLRSSHITWSGGTHTFYKDLQGVAVGTSLLEVSASTFTAPLLPLLPSYEFAREYLGINYEEFLQQVRAAR